MTENKLEIPTLRELIKTLEEDKPYRPLDFTPNYNFPSIALKNNANKDQFIVSRLASGRFALKPNLTDSKYLFRGQRCSFSPCYPSLFRSDKESYIIENLKVDEFRILVRSHPLSIMFEHGVNLGHNLPPFFFEMNYYGLAQHYGFNTGVLDFTSDINVAAFFATTIRNADGKYSPILEEDNLGELMVHEINSETFNFNNFTSIGLQIFPRSGKQKGFLYRSEKGHDINNNPSIKKLSFKHSKEDSQYFFDKLNQGQDLLPKDNLEPLANKILESKKISLAAITDNSISNNEKDLNATLRSIEDSGLEIDPSRKIIFERSDLKKYYDDIKNGLWEEFCKQIYFAGDNSQSLNEQLLKLPQNKSYEQFFKEEYFSKISMFRKYS